MFHITNDIEVKKCPVQTRQLCQISDRPHFHKEIDAWRAQDEMSYNPLLDPSIKVGTVLVDNAYNTPILEIKDGLVLDRDSGRTYGTDLKIAPVNGMEDVLYYRANAREARNLSRSNKAVDLVVNSDTNPPIDELFNDEYIVIERRAGWVMSPNVIIVEIPRNKLDKNDFLKDHDFAIEYSDNFGKRISMA